MSLKSLPIPPVPEETARVARAVFPRGNALMQLRDTLGSIYTMRRLLICFPRMASQALAPWRLALVTIMQFLEHLTDRQAADAVRSCLDWKYALSLELTDTGFDHTVLSEFRARLVQGNAEQRLLDLLLQRCREGGWLKVRGRQRTDSTHVLAKIRALNRVVCVAQCMVYVLNVLSKAPPLGSVLTCQPSGSSAMGSGLNTNACRRRSKSVSSTQIKWELMAGLCSVRWRLLSHRTG